MTADRPERAKPNRIQIDLFEDLNQSLASEKRLTVIWCLR